MIHKYKMHIDRILLQEKKLYVPSLTGQKQYGIFSHIQKVEFIHKFCEKI